MPLLGGVGSLWGPALGGTGHEYPPSGWRSDWPGVRSGWLGPCHPVGSQEPEREKRQAADRIPVCVRQAVRAE